MDDDIDDLLGGPQEDEDDLLGASEFAEIEDDEDGLPVAIGGARASKSLSLAGANLVQRGVTAGWFASVLGIGRTTVNRKLADVTPKRTAPNGMKLYDVRTTMPYLVLPHDLKNILARMSPKDLPERLRKDYWTARKAEQSVRETARDLWRSDDVHRALGDIAKLVKDTVTLWTDDIDESVGLSAEQIEVLDRLSRDLLLKINQSVMQYVQNGVTRSQEIEFDEGEDA
jgi:hypothetical protein